MKKSTSDDFMAKNEKAWDEVTPIHNSYRKGQEEFFRNGGSILDTIERQHLPDVAGMNLAHLCCNCGQDTISLANLGAKCVGFDQSAAAIEEARYLAEKSGVHADFAKANVLDIPDNYSGKFDIVYISRGVLVWIPDINALMKSVSKLLHKGGRLFLYDQHPLMHIFDQYADNPKEAKFDYFNEEPYEYSGLDYIGGSTYEASPNYQYMVRLSDILNGLRENGMVLSSFHEFRHTIEKSMSEQFKIMGVQQEADSSVNAVSEKAGIPGMMLLKAVKQD